ncbi:MAG: class I SAM-dependent methyltransferase [Pseudomonadota bacterium]
MIKRTYVEAMQGLGKVEPLAMISRNANDNDPYGWRRWFASLFAIYETDRMIELDLPWWNVEATREIEAFLAARPEARVFEYGSGASTVWLARRAHEVITVEHDGDWLRKFERQTRGFDHVNLLHRSIENSPEAYVNAIDEFEGDFDLIVVDGRHRNACLERSAPRLKADGIVLYDDSGRSRYRSAIEGIDLVETQHYGRSYCVPYPDYTSLLRHGSA